ncbi:unnamed protein product [Cylindrotheca closterium]|uniref:AB hydrolase-1 domain-containing protein n=1 Tax=Cylindrotheca closterium TaxID=2856 RepID=A0AAD2CSV0_9STRA|nr:unnamed protein product [Cylindrotheca closterium]
MRIVFFDIFILLSVLSCIECGKSYVIQPNKWDYRGHDIAFEVSHSRGDSDVSTIPSKKTPILLLNGFGVGSFHQHRLIAELVVSDKEESSNVDNPDDDNYQTVYCIDYLGQGSSWPRDCADGLSENEKGLAYCAELWIDQLATFIEQVVMPQHQGKKVHVVGNSVGGHLAAHLAYQRPDLVETICLLNPTPVWGLNLPGWSGHLPPPKVPRAIGRFLFDKIRELGTIEKYLDAAYTRKDAFDETLMNQIRACTLGAGGHAAFASILWSKPLLVAGEKDFQKCLAGVDCDVLLLFGKDDPWCKPAFAKKMLQALNSRKNGKAQRYVEVENCGHCPNHEAPQAVGSVVTKWVNSMYRDAKSVSLVRSEKEVFDEAWGATPISERQVEDIELSLLDRVAVTFV